VIETMFLLFAEIVEFLMFGVAFEIVLEIA